MRKLALVALIGAAACGDGTETGNPFTGEARLHAHSSEPGRVAVVSTATEARIDGVWLVTGPITLIGEDCASPLAMTPTPAGGDNHAGPVVTVEFELTPDPVCAIAIPLAPAAVLPAGAPPELDGQSVLVTGTRISDMVPFRIRAAITSTLTLAKTGDPFTFTADDPAMFLGFDVASWITADLDLAGATPTAGTIEIDSTMDPARTVIFAGHLASGIELYSDHDRDGSAAGEDKLADGG